MAGDVTNPRVGGRWARSNVGEGRRVHQGSTGHVPGVKYGRDSDLYFNDFLTLQPDEQTGTRALRLIVMNRLRPIHDPDGEQLGMPFGSALHVCSPPCGTTTPINAIPRSSPPHWVNGIHHCDININNLMYSPSGSPPAKPEGVLDEYDLASWDKFPTTNGDRTWTIPFTAPGILSGRLEDRIP